MGETRIAYPGLVRPYTEQTDYVNQPKFIRTMYNSTSHNNVRSCSTSDHDPFSIYDDDTAHDHYFFLPAGQMEVKRTCSESERTGRWSRSKPLVEKHSKPPDIPTNRTPRTNRSNTFSTTNTPESPNPARCDCPTPSQKDNVPRPSRPCARQNNNRTLSTTSASSPTQSQRHSLITKDGGGRCSALSGDYCSLSVHAVAPPFPNLLHPNDAPIDEEKFRKFANHLIRDPCDINKNSNDYHDPSRTNKNGGSGDAVEMYDMDKCIDHCTCMLCVKAGRYHWAGDGDSFIEEPCSCVGGRKNIVRRWLCMGVLALFLPCLICYLPAKLCQKSCRSKRCSSGKLKDTEGRRTADSEGRRTVVKYVDKGGGGGSEVKLQPTGML